MEKRKSLSQKLQESLEFINSNSSCSTEDVEFDIANKDFEELEEIEDSNSSCTHDWRPYKVKQTQI